MESRFVLIEISYQAALFATFKIGVGSRRRSVCQPLIFLIGEGAISFRRFTAEVLAIWRYLEDTYPQPVLLGASRRRRFGDDVGATGRARRLCTDHGGRSQCRLASRTAHCRGRMTT